MRIAAHPPAALPPPALAAALPAGLLRQALAQPGLLQVAAIASATLWTLPDRQDSGARDSTVASPPLPLPPSLPAPPPVPGPGAPPAATAGPALAMPASTTVPGLPLPSLAAAALLAAPAQRDRVSLSPAATAACCDPLGLEGRPAAELTRRLLVGLTGEPPERLQLLAFDAAARAASSIAGRIPKGTGERLQLLVRGQVRSADARRVEMTLGLGVQRQSGSLPMDRAVLDAIAASLDRLAQLPIDLDHPGPAAGLAGHSARFQAVLDPLGPWPMQGFLLSGLLVLGPARDDDEAADSDAGREAPSADPEADADADRDGNRSEREDKQPTPRPKRNEAEALPPDGGPPIISGSHWLELELGHWRSQLRLWMNLPPGVTARP